MITRVVILAFAFGVGFAASFAALSTAADATWMPFSGPTVQVSQ